VLMVFCTGCAGCGIVELGRKMCAPQLTTKFHTTTASTTSAEHHMQ